MPDEAIKEEIEILSKKELDRTIKRLASQILEKIPNIGSLLLIGIPTRGVCPHFLDDEALRIFSINFLFGCKKIFEVDTKINIVKDICFWLFTHITAL